MKTTGLYLDADIFVPVVYFSWLYKW